ncbi:lysoplasmalogenase [soil metagenome]
MNSKPLSYSYWLIAIVHLVLEAMLIMDMQSAMIPAMVTKALLMPVLIWYYYKATAPAMTTAQKLILIGLVFSWSGDVNLMMPRLENCKPYEELFFLAGLVSFLITHVLYIFAFKKELTSNSQPAILKIKPWLALPILGAYAGLLAFLVPTIQLNQPDMLLPVLVYASVITAMVISAINRKGKVSAASFGAVLAGAVLFMFSDSVIAISKFHTPFALAPLVIMATYITSQYLFAWGTRRGA